MKLNIDATPQGRGFLIYIDEEPIQLTLSSLKLLMALIAADDWLYPEDFSAEKYLSRAIYRLRKETYCFLEFENNKYSRCYRICLELKHFDSVTVNVDNIIKIGDHFLIEKAGSIF